MRPIGPKLSNMLSTPKAKKIIKAGGLTLIESAKVAATMLTKDPVSSYPLIKGSGDFLEFAIRFTVGLFRKNPEKNFDKIVFGNSANLFSDSVMYVCYGGKKSKEIITSSFK